MLGEQSLNFVATFNLIKKRENRRTYSQYPVISPHAFLSRSEALDCSGRKMRTQCDRVITFHDEDYDETVEIVLHNGKETGTDGADLRARPWPELAYT